MAKEPIEQEFFGSRICHKYAGCCLELERRASNMAHGLTMKARKEAWGPVHTGDQTSVVWMSESYASTSMISRKYLLTGECLLTIGRVSDGGAAQRRVSTLLELEGSG